MLTLPYPNSPTNGDNLDADPVRANIQALAQGVQSFDGSQIQAGTLVEGAFTSAVNPRLRGSETFANFIVSPGCTWSSVSGLNGTMTSGTAYYNGYRTAVASVGSHAFTANRDTYIDVDNLGNITYAEVGNGAAAPALTASSQRIAKIVTSGSTITGITQGGLDVLGNVIYNTSPSGVNVIFFPTYTNGWVDYDTTSFGRVHFYKDKVGVVHIMGMMKSGTVNQPAFTLPAGYRPANNLIFPGVSVSAFCRLDVSTTGVVTPTTGTNSDVSISSIQFMAMN